MAINLSQAFNRTAPAPIDGSLVLSKADMLAVNDNLMPEKYFTICIDDGQIYTYDKNATPNAQTGKFSPYNGGGTGVPIGAIIGMSGGTTVPDGFLKANGQIVNIADYPYLAQYYEDNYGAANHFGGDGTTTFAIEDVQGEFLRGTGTNSHTNQGSGAAVGTHQDATVHIYAMNDSASNNIVYDKITDVSASGPSNADNFLKAPSSAGAKYYPFNVDANNKNVQSVYYSRPTNTSVLWVVCASKPANTTTEYEGGTGIEINGNVISARVDYSLEEKVVGTWIDGKPLYQKTIVPSTTTQLPNKTSFAIPTGITANVIETLVNITGIIKENSSGGQWRLLPQIQDNDSNMNCAYQLNKSGSTIEFFCRNGNVSMYDIKHITLLYTKTTDA